MHGPRELELRRFLQSQRALTAQLLQADSLGQIAVGKVADLVVLNGDPTQNITATRNIAWVMTRGRILRPDSLRASWK